jgi:hypothetical protein
MHEDTPSEPKTKGSLLGLRAARRATQFLTISRTSNTSIMMSDSEVLERFESLTGARMVTAIWNMMPCCVVILLHAASAVKIEGQTGRERLGGDN